ncbi:glycosylphosphatidylinositol anchor attachment 1 [Arctopsyche grandis]|uniref:glycosylphosphatidylinositol anchor attachment 1 n=1 Tax=Arctopsyche grandis TaxID=121162 RepID=UPI00406D8EFC
MSLLSDPETRPNKYSYNLVRIHLPLCLFACFVAYAWFCLLAHEFFSNGNYFSENALLPGLVQSDFVNDGSAKQYYNELEDEIRENYANRDSIPIPWLAAKMHQINLDVYTHNFTLHYPLGKGQVFHGENVYGILRAGRSASSEALVLSAPYRPLSSQHRPTNAGIALMLAFAKFARSRKYWAKDIIMLVTEHEQLGAQAWLEAYHGMGSSGRDDIRYGPFYSKDGGQKSRKKILDSGNLKGRAGAIQAAINLELPALSIKYIDVKVEGLNGQLPNLDLVNLVHKMCMKWNVHNSYKNSYSWVGNRGPWQNWLNSLNTLFAMVTTQLTGVPTGNHGLFHRFGIEAVTMEGIEGGAADRDRIPKMGRPAHALEGTLRSLNNLLERFHQSFFFYLRPGTERFVSIGQYMPPLGILTGALFIKAFAVWLTTRVHNAKMKFIGADDFDTDENAPPRRSNLLHIGIIYLVTHLIGYGVQCSPQIISEIGVEYFMLPTEEAIYYGFAAIASVLIVVLPTILNAVQSKPLAGEELRLLNILVLLELATLVLSVGMHNFSLGFCLAAVYAPFALLVKIPTNKIPSRFSRFCKFLSKTTWLLLHPLILTTLVVCCYTVFMFPEDSSKMLISRGIRASQQAIMFSIVDGMIYGNWLFNVVTTVLFPTWMLFWHILNTSAAKKLI